MYVGNSTFKTAVASDVISFNHGAKGLLPVFCQLGIEPGYYTMKGCTRVDFERIKQSDCKLTDGVKSFNDKNKLDEGETYASGLF